MRSSPPIPSAMPNAKHAMPRYNGCLPNTRHLSAEASRTSHRSGNSTTSTYSRPCPNRTRSWQNYPLFAPITLSAEEKERLTAALDKQYDKLMAVSKAKMDKARALNEEAIRLFKKVDVLSEQIEVLRAQRRKTDD